MTEETKKRIAEIGWAIREVQHDVKRLKRDIAKAEKKIIELDGERWQLILTP